MGIATTWYQYYTTVDEGSPISPPFETQQELVDWIVDNGDPVYGEMSRESVERFVYGPGWAPTMVGRSDGTVVPGVEAVL